MPSCASRAAISKFIALRSDRIQAGLTNGNCRRQVAGLCCLRGACISRGDPMRASIRALLCTLGLIALQTGQAESADVVVGYITSLTGSTASIGIPYQKGMEAAQAK